MSETWNTTVYSVLIDSDEQKLFFESVGDDGKYSLPSGVIDVRPLWMNSYEDLQSSLAKPFNTDINILRRIYMQEEFEKKIAEAAFAIEIVDKSTPKGHWLSLQELATMDANKFDQADIVQTIILEMDNDEIPKGRPKWAEAGWYEKTDAWITSTLENLGYKVKEISLVKTWNISCVQKVETDKGDVYFKANYDFPLFSDEAALYAFLRKDFPKNTPEILAANVEDGYFLLKGYSFASKESVYENQHKLLKQAFEFHKAYSNQKEAVLEIPCADRSLEFLAQQLVPILEADYVQEQSSQEDLDYLKANFSKIQAIAKELDDGSIPHTLIHGDLHMGNVAFDNDNTVFLDWTDGCYSHPFFDATHDIYFWKDRALADKLRDEYIALWVEHLDDVTYDELLRLWNIAVPLYLLQRVVTDHSFVENMEVSSQYEFKEGCVWFLSQAIQKFKQL